MLAQFQARRLLMFSLMLTILPVWICSSPGWRPLSQGALDVIPTPAASLAAFPPCQPQTDSAVACSLPLLTGATSAVVQLGWGCAMRTRVAWWRTCSVTTTRWCALWRTIGTPSLSLWGCSSSSSLVWYGMNTGNAEPLAHVIVPNDGVFLKKQFLSFNPDAFWYCLIYFFPFF